ncbi:hypothetical protein AB0F43_10865 [Kribbella sp. NPDC023972]|uniref:hypothetical protein n=1 Tax=Kribbella sp. NPDC023972 TaxID=3154795 RepID=UPI0033F6FBA9
MVPQLVEPDRSQVTPQLAGGGKPSITYIKADYDEELLSLLRDAYREARDGQA